ncbi:hypothetical protein SDC9_89699 [bioreactor metagenome]|uniref:Uncharacterized protein n=1 Tax=bioreactor metagenome TaxID=1076179 RepID=A0A644ZQJ3_9ZZZZ
MRSRVDSGYRSGISAGPAGSHDGRVVNYKITTSQVYPLASRTAAGCATRGANSYAACHGQNSTVTDIAGHINAFSP